MLIKTKTLMSAFLIAAIVVFVLMAGSEARVTGTCVNCHTMHNSQGGVAVNSAGPQEFLLNKGGGTVTTCWGCHAQTTALNILDLTPQIRHTYATDLAGGNFAYITGGKSLGTGATTKNVGHNVTDTAVSDTNLSAPPGDENATGVTNAGATRVTCAGVYGCHGDRTIAGVGLSMKGAHHTIDTVLKFGGPISETGQGSTAGLSYRFLKGVKGGEEANWMGVSPSSTVHNEYKGAIGTGTESTINTNPSGTISGLCAECHGTFHGPGGGDVNTASPFLRHPADLTLPASGEYTEYTTYNLTAPVARTAIPSSPSGTVTPSGATNDIIMCLSCHRAHASANFKMTRWDYKNATLSTAISGCNVCHTSKN